MWPSARDGADLIAGFGRLPIPASNHGVRAGERLILGVRPSDLRLASEADASVRGAVQQLEPLGDITIVSLLAGGEMLRLVLPEAQAVGVKPGDSLTVAVDMSKAHLFRGHDGSAFNRQS